MINETAVESFILTNISEGSFFNAANKDDRTSQEDLSEKYNLSIIFFCLQIYHCSRINFFYGCFFLPDKNGFHNN